MRREGDASLGAGHLERKAEEDRAKMTQMTDAAGPKPKKKGDAMIAGAAKVSTPAWSQRGMVRRVVIWRARYERMCDACVRPVTLALTWRDPHFSRSRSRCL